MGNDVHVTYCDENHHDGSTFICSMNGRTIDDSSKEDDPIWVHAMEFRSLCHKIMVRVGPLWRASLFLAISQQLAMLEKDDKSIGYVIDGDFYDEGKSDRRQGVMEKYVIFATSLQQLGLIGIWNEKPIMDGGKIKQ